MVNGEHATGKVIGRKRTADGELVGKYHPNRNLDTRQYEVEYQNGTREAHLMNSIAVALHLELDDDGKRWYTFDSIVDHKPGEGGKGRTKGWLLEIIWKDGTATWETLTAMKEMNMPRCAEYAKRLGLVDEPAFSYWVKFALKKRYRLLKQVVRRKRSNRFKYGIAVPRTVKEAYALDTANGNNFWAKAIDRKMSNVMVAFKPLDLGASPLEDCKEIPLRMIFDVKMDFARKARVVAGGHRTDPPEALTYLSVVSCDSVWLAFMLAKLNGLDMIMTDIGNAYLQGRTVVIVRALYGLKSAGAAWNHHLANELMQLEFEPVPADPDVWRRAHVKSDGTKYYEYVFVYVDDLLCLSVDPVGRIIQPLSDLGYRCKDVGKPTRYLGAEIAERGAWRYNGSTYCTRTWYRTTAYGLRMVDY